MKLDIHEVEFFERKGSALGVVVDCERLCTSITSQRRCRLERALAYALQRGRLGPGSGVPPGPLHVCWAGEAR
eukprot:9131539-Pyramimonas_sp.AAC.1